MTLDRLKLELQLKGYSKKTIESYVRYNKSFLKFASKRPSSITKDDVKKYMAYLLSEKNYDNTSINNMLAALRFYYHKVLEKPILVDIENLKTKKALPVVLTKEETNKLLNATKNTKHRLILDIMFSSGLRVSECVSLKKEDINFEDNMITVRHGKGNKGRTTVLAKRTAAALKKYFKNRKDNSTYVFPGRNKHISVKLAQKVIKQSADAAGIEKNVFCHALRSTFATQLLNQGVDIRVIQQLLGHSKVNTTQRYTKVSKEIVKKVKSPGDALEED